MEPVWSVVNTHIYNKYIYVLKVKSSAFRVSAHCQHWVTIAIIQSVFALKDQEFSKNLRDVFSGIVLGNI